MILSNYEVFYSVGSVKKIVLRLLSILYYERIIFLQCNFVKKLLKTNPF